MRAALYARVSTSEQHPENQLIDLRRYARDRGFMAVEEFVDHGVSGARDTRPALDRMMDMARKRKVDAIVVWRFDRFARSVRHLVLALDELKALGVAFVSFQEAIDTSTPMGQAMFTIVAAMAQLERSILIERVRCGMARSRARGVHVGRPLMGEASVEEMQELIAQGLRQHQVAERLGVSRAYVSRKLAPHKGVVQSAS